MLAYLLGVVLKALQGGMLGAWAAAGGKILPVWPLVNFFLFCRGVCIAASSCPVVLTWMELITMMPWQRKIPTPPGIASFKPSLAL